MGNLYFEDKYGTKRLIAEDIPQNMIGYHIKNYAEFLNPDFKIYYTRAWMEKSGTIKYDVGSHSEFFIYMPNEVFQ